MKNLLEPEPAGDRSIRDLREVQYSSREIDRLVRALKETSREAATVVVLAGASKERMTMAAEAIAKQLELSLFRVDVSQVISKYIGETEKNLDSVFRDASVSGSALFFDEADALFGERSEGEPAGDRDDPVEVRYLLQHIDAYMGIVFIIVNHAEPARQAMKTLRRVSTVVVVD